MSDTDLIKAAASVRKSAYAPYSKFTVGAALLGTNGDLFVGCNVENMSLGLTICAERAAVSAAICAGCRDFAAIAIVSDSKEPAVPCGACRQVLAEFSPSMKVLISTLAGEVEELTLTTLLPKPDQGIHLHV